MNSKLNTFSLDNKAQMSRWDEFVESHPAGTPYHLSFWLRTICDTYGFEPLLYLDSDANRDITGIFPLFSVKGFIRGSHLVSLPFSDYGGPLFQDKLRETEILKKVIDLHSTNVKYIEIRGPVPNDTPFFSHNYYKRHLIDLSADLSSLRRKINKRTIQYSIRKAEKMGIVISEENNQYGIAEFYRLNMLTRKKHGVPGQSKKFFENLLRHLFASGHAFLLLALYDSKPVAGSLFLRSGKGIHYKYNASDPAYLGRTTPNHLLTWHAVRQGHEAGYKYMDFGRTSPDNTGLMRYKKMWGADERDVTYNYYPEIQGASSTEESSWIYQKFTSIWRCLPNWVTEKLGPVIYRYTG